ncbi:MULTISPECIES: hypothetical protein [Flavobacterium]|uniref:Uncharacterized protein n=1 Tax=Flavobacterium faecale TaxID=1355330 RepID=A0A2S1LGD9_9FLAO|nr:MULTISPECIES: hypothetical protein [Flavobacterium]AWG22824.1 hypothetical protein FFWV33_15460 [Flavobacterium faecale]MBE0393248.1 hypothetical protein [Flavobacterium sp. PL002]
MFTNISWGNYIVVIVLLLASWYLFIGFRYYLFDITEIVTGKRKIRKRRIKDLEIHYDVVHPQTLTGTSKQTSLGETEETILDIDTFAEKLKNLVKVASQREVIKSEFIGHLSLLFTEYSSIKNSPFRSSVSELIISECEKLDTISLSYLEVEDLWNE